jgi:4,5:9,10-diseco-3-hydroxy-5,9,17-trioxoandrosta-1(10),2-diene-4-oate hydrolase
MAMTASPTVPYSNGYLAPADGISLHVTEVGAGHPLVWLHGSGPGATGMSNFGPNLKRFGGYRNLVFDLPRYGQSDAPAIDEPLIGYAARQVAAALDNLGVEQAHLIGNSFGGSTAIRIAADRPDLVTRVVSMGGSARPAGTFEWPEGLRILFDYMSRPEPSRELLEGFVRAMVIDQSLVTDALIDARLAASRRVHPEIRVVPPDQGDLKPHLGKVRAPTLLIWGREDRFIPLEWALITLRGIENASLYVAPHCGHWVQVEAREAFERLVLDFLA